jgi:hypothetical protein
VDELHISIAIPKQTKPASLAVGMFEKTKIIFVILQDL